MSGSDHSIEGEIQFEKRGRIGRILLNRPKALNTLTLPMCDALTAQLRDWSHDDGVKAIVIRGAGERAFCAGGDVVRLYEDGRAKGPYPGQFFRSEYRCNTIIKTYTKPYISLLDGFVMGGGAGVSVHGSHCVVSEKTVFAMPETGIGLYPDVGGSYFLPRMPGKTGLYLGLTGHRIKAADCITLKLAEGFVPSVKMDALENALAADADVNKVRISDIIRSVAESAPAGTVQNDLARIDRHFSHTTVEAILESLRTDTSEWAGAVLKDLSGKSPLSLKVTLRGLLQGGHLTFAQAMQMEWRIAMSAMDDSDFYEGVRALLVDKDQKPQWRPASLAQVTDANVDRFFAPRPGNELDLSDLTRGS